MQTKKVIEPYNIHLDAFWSEDIPKAEKMIRKLDAESLKKLYGMTINITDKHFFPHPKTGEAMTGLTRSGLGGKPYLIILSKDPDPRRLYHEVAHAIGIEDETKAMEFAIKKEMEFFGKGSSTPPLERLGRGQTVNELLPMSMDQGPPLPRGLNVRWPWRKP